MSQKKVHFMSCIQKLQVNSSKHKNLFPLILCANMTSFVVWPRKEANLRFSKLIYVSFLTLTHTSNLFWVSHAPSHFELSHSGLDVMVIVKISHCALVKWNQNWRGSFFKNTPDGAGWSLKCIKSKNWQHFEFKNFLRPSTLLLCEKKVC